MSSLTQRVLTYGLLARPFIDTSVVDTTTTNAALLSQINSLLGSAAASFTARDYNGALNTYFASQSLIYAHLDPQWDPDLTNKFRPLLPRDPTLFDPLLSATCQWLDLLPVPVSVSPVRPTVAVTAQLLSGVAGTYGAGVSQVSTNPAATADALADMHLATIFAAQGNTAASSAIVTRAQGLNATIATVLAPTTALAPAPAPVAPAPAAAAAATTAASAAPIAHPVTAVHLEADALAVSPASSAVVAQPVAASTVAVTEPVAARATTSALRLSGLTFTTPTAPPTLTVPNLPIALLAQKHAEEMQGVGMLGLASQELLVERSRLSQTAGLMKGDGFAENFIGLGSGHGIFC